MILSYPMRLLCVLLVVGGFAEGVAQLALAFGARFILRRLEFASARRREHALYLVQLAPALLAGFVAIALCLPAYLHFEPNHAMESVSLASVVISFGFVLWFASGLLRGLRITVRTLRFARSRHAAGHIALRNGALPVLVVPHLDYPLALIGFFRPRVLVSSDFLNAAGGFESQVFALALAHERAHAAHRDNWKMLSLSFLPRLDGLLPGGARLRQLWQTAADWAADDEAVDGDPLRSLQLAEALVRAARSVRPSQQSLLCTALTSAEAGLAARVQRLTDLQHTGPPNALSVAPGFAVLALIAAGALALAPWIYPFSEWLLHFGSA